MNNEKSRVEATASSTYGDREDQMESTSFNILATDQPANRRNDQGMQHLLTQSEETTT